MALINFFWSYSRFDDKNDNDRVRQLFADIKGEYRAITGEETESSFIDHENISWGDDWEAVIYQNISNLPFFIPVITPSYFRSANCMNELKHFLNLADNQGKVLLLPILYIEVEEFPLTDPNYELLRKIKETDYIDWTHLRFLPLESEEYRTNVNAIAKELKKRNQQLEPITLMPIEEQDTDDMPGLLDHLVDFDEAIDEFIGSQKEINEIITVMTDIINTGSNELHIANAQNKPMSAKLILIKKLANDLEVPVDELFEMSKQHSVKIGNLDKKMPALFELISITPGSIEHERICELEKSLNNLVEASTSSADSLQSILKGTELIARMSRDFRPIIRKQNSAITLIQEAYLAFERWVDQFKSLGLSCH